MKRCFGRDLIAQEDCHKCPDNDACSDLSQARYSAFMSLNLLIIDIEAAREDPVFKKWLSGHLPELAAIAGYSLVPVTEKAWPLKRIIR